MPTTFSKPILPHPLPIPPSLNRRPIVLAFLVFVLLRSRAITLSKDALVSLRNSISSVSNFQSRKRKLDPDELAKVLQQVYIDEPDGSKTLLVPYRERVIKVPIRPTPKTKFLADTPHFPLLVGKAASKPNIDLAFLAQLRAILFRVAIPSWRTSEAGIVVLHSTFLVLRTVLSIMVARLDGRIVRDIVKADGKGFLKGLALWFLLAIPSSFTNSMIRHFQSLLALRLRTRLTRYLHDLYLSSNPDLRYYRASNYLEGIDQYLTADVEAWSNALSGLYGNILKPSLDLVLFTSQLSRSLGVRGTLLLFLNYYTTVAILRAVTPAFGRLAAVEARLEGEYRAGMGRVGREAEEVAFYDGGARERDILTKAYTKLIKHINSIYKIRIAYEWTEDYVIKYLWSAAGYALIAVPILFTRTKRSLGLHTGVSSIREGRDEAVAGRTETYISNRRLLLSLADAGGRLMYAYKDLLELAGLTTRLYTLLSTLLNLPKGYEPLRIEKGDEISLRNVEVRVPRISTGKKYEHDGEAKTIDKIVVNDNEDGLGVKPVEDNLNDPPLVQDLNLVIKRGDHMMITGSNGVGKTAVARLLAGLWDPLDSGVLLSGEQGGHVQMPRDETDTDAFFALSAKAAHTRPRPTLYVLPQRSYMPVGSLLEQIIYPCSYATFIKMTSSAPPAPVRTTSMSFLPAALSRSASTTTVSALLSSTPSPSVAAIHEIHEILEKVHLGYLIEREGGLHVRKEWRDVLSGGEKQRMGMARVLWWRPKWAVLDECTSAVSGDVEGRMYEAAKALDITLITISLRPSLAKYHSQLLTLHGPSGSQPGKWTLSRVGTAEERMSVRHEIDVLEEKLREVEGWEKRVKELEAMLSVQEGVNADGELDELEAEPVNDFDDEAKNAGKPEAEAEEEDEQASVSTPTCKCLQATLRPAKQSRRQQQTTMNGLAASQTDSQDVRDIMGKPGLHYDIIEEGPASTVARAWTAIEDGKPQWVVVKSASTVRKFAREPHDAVKELRVLSSLAHPNIVNLMGSFLDEQQMMLSIYMPYLPISLAEILASPLFSPHPLPSLSVPDEDAFKLPEERFKVISKSIMLQTLCALAFLHDDQRRIAHRDVKPENIMLTKEGCVKLIDFGTTWKEGESDKERKGDLWPEYRERLYFEVSTRAYRAPELLFGSRTYDPRALDLWSLGATFAEFFTPLRLSSEDQDDCDDEEDETEADDGTQPLEPFIVPKYLRIGYPGAQWARDSLFNGERGEIGLAWSIFKVLGTPTAETWPEFEDLPGSKSVVFNIVPSVPLAPLLPNLPASSLALDLRRFLVYPSSMRLRAEDALQHEWFIRKKSKSGESPDSIVLLPKGYCLTLALGTGTSVLENVVRNEWRGKTLAEWLDSVLKTISRGTET